MKWNIFNSNTFKRETNKQNKYFSKKRALITGASSGIGAALAKALAEKGTHLILLARRRNLLEALKKEILATHPHLEIDLYVQDVGNLAAFQKTATILKKQKKKIHFLFANAGFALMRPILKCNLADFHRQWDTNVFGVLNTFYSFLPFLSNPSHLIVLGSVNTYATLPNIGPYAMSKAALRPFCEALYLEASSKIVTTFVCPGLIQTQIRKVDCYGTYHPEAKDPIPSWAQLSSEKAAQHILKAVYRKKREVILTFHGKIAIYFAKIFPSLFFKLLKFFKIQGRKTL